MNDTKRRQRAIQAFEAYQEKKSAQVQNNEKLKYVKARKCIRPLLRFLLFAQRKLCGFQVELLNEITLENKSPVIFAVTHIGKWDIEIVNEQIPYHFYIVVSDFINTYGQIGGWFLNTNGAIWVNEDSKADKANTKERMKQILSQGDNVMIFPEGTWNLSENEIIRDIAYGAADAALQTGAAIIPIAVEQYEGRFVINRGAVLSAVDFADKTALTVAIRDALAALKWEIWEREGVQSRAELSDTYWEDFIAERRKEWPGYSMREQFVNTYIPKYKLEYWQVQRDLNTGLLPRWYEMAMCECAGEKIKIGDTVVGGDGGE
ncbi:MAG: 1-acyl-sn-glycerol-3-phosphate acyltransferase [Blautia sp.]|nr:1-acyl-sn-glycerol-3-phosphate acyltransferase [Blautia sp.]